MFAGKIRATKGLKLSGAEGVRSPRGARRDGGHEEEARRKEKEASVQVEKV